MNKPLVSCVMPTWNRRAFIPAALDCFMRQTYDNRELVILDDGTEPVQDLLPAKDTRVRYFFENRRRITGDKRNRVNSLAKGSIICHWDDDDWSADNRLEFQVDLLLKSGKPVTGFSDLLFWDEKERLAKRFVSSMKGYACGTTLCYKKDFWVIHQFRPRHESSDNDFVYPILNQIAASKDTRYMVARIHNCHHTSEKTGVQDKVAVNLIPAEFWENDKRRLS